MTFVPLHVQPMPKISKQDPYLELVELVNSRISLYYKGESLLKARAQVQHELNIIKQLGVAEYFLIVHDYVAWALANNIPQGNGRGAAPASIVNYILGITAVEPLSNGLIFERFINSDRISLPDIAVDFSSKKERKLLNISLINMARKTLP